MNIDLLAVLARVHVADLLKDASRRRARRRPLARGAFPRIVAARALRAIGGAAISLGDAVAPRVV